MLPLETRATLNGWQEERLFKVAGLQEFATGQLPLERMLLDLRDADVQPHSAALSSLPWAGLIVGDDQADPVSGRSIRLDGDPTIVKPGDVLEVQPHRSKVAVRYRRGSNGNVLFATERCNSFCLMCSQPPREIADHWRVQQMCDLADLIDSDESSLAISGGEPTLLDEGLLTVIRHCRERLPDTHIHVLSNGRRFAAEFPTAKLDGAHHSLTWGVPLYGDTASLHDYVVQSRGAFAETMRGLYALHQAQQRIELRILLVRPVVDRLPELARFLYRNLPFVEHVALMGVEATGLALANYERLWIDPVDAHKPLAQALHFLDARGMTASLYNTPLCALPRELWPFARRSISDWKQVYPEVCAGCTVQEQCSGVFSWDRPAWRSRAISPVGPEAFHA